MSADASSPLAAAQAPVVCNDDACKPAWKVRGTSLSTTSSLISALPFIITFILIAVVFTKRIFPALCNAERRISHEFRAVSITFGATIGAAVVLGELIVCEVSNWVDHDVRRLGFKITVGVLLTMIVGLIPVMQIRGYVSESRVAKWGRKWEWAFIGILWTAWAWLFWVPAGQWLPADRSGGFGEECLGRVALIGISIMAILAGFGCVSSPWHTFFTRVKPVSDIEVARAQGGLENAIDLLKTKQARLHVLEQKIKDKPVNEGYLSKVMTTFRGDADVRERSALQTEIAGLDIMRQTLASDLAELQKAQAAQVAKKSVCGRLLLTASWFFSLYCLYRIAITSSSHIPFMHKKQTFSQSDPINNIIALLLKHYDPHLDRAAWSRQIGFAFSGVIIACTFNSAVTTFRILSRAAPSNISAHLGSSSSSAGTITPGVSLLLCQISGAYVLATAFLLRSNLPPELSSAITVSLGTPIDPTFIDSYFDHVFLGTVVLSAAGMAIARKLLASAASEDEDLEAGTLKEKRNLE